MKKKVLLVVGGLVVLGLLFPLSNLVVQPDHSGLLSSLRPQDAAFEPVAGVLEGKCAGCHVRDADLPFYAGLPVAGGIIRKDVDTGLRFMDFSTELTAADAPIPETTLAKIEHSIEAGTMPPLPYKAMHWGSGVKAADRDAVGGWVRNVRVENYATPGVAPTFAGTAVQPLQAAEVSNPELVALGGRLFHDTRLSGDDTVSCASCHALDLGGTDRARFSTGIDGQVGGINSPTVYNAAYAVRQFWDGRAADLTEQAGGPVTNPIEMGAEWPDVIAKLSKDAAYRREFASLFEEGITQENVQVAIAAFEETLVTPNSKFDRFLMGEDGALDSQEKQGYELFAQRSCATCHVGRILGGQSFEYMGLRADYFSERGEITDADNGRFNFTGVEGDRHKFKVPTLRNVAVTYPYFHDGSTSDLAEAVRIMARYQLASDLPEDETEKIVAFLETLTGEYEGELLR